MLTGISAPSPIWPATAATERQIRLALAYHERFPEDIDALIADNMRSLEQLHSEHPFIALGTRSA